MTWCLLVCLSVFCHKSEFYRNGYKRTELVFDTELTLRLFVHCVIRKLVYLQKTTVLPSGTLSRTLDLEKFRQCTSTVARVVNIVPPTTIASLSHSASTFVYNTMGVTQRVSGVRQQQLRLVDTRVRTQKTDTLHAIDWGSVYPRKGRPPSRGGCTF